MKLYEIPTAIRDAIEYDEETGELTDASLTRITDLELTLEAKADAICSIIREQLTLASAVGAEIDRLSKLKQTRDNAAARLKEYLRMNLELLGKPKLDMERFKVRIQRNSTPSVECLIDADKLPTEYQHHRIEPNKKAAADYWKKNGAAPDGFSVHVGNHLRIS